MKSIFIDTDVLIDYSKGRSRLLEKLLDLQNEGKAKLLVNPVVVAEYFTDNTLDKKHAYELAEEFIGQCTVKEITKKMGLVAGELLRRKQVLFLGDALVSASCLVDKLALVTRNRRHFAGVPGLEFYEAEAN